MRTLPNAATNAAAAVEPLSDDEIHQLQERLDAVPTPHEPLDIMALDGFLCGVLLQPTRVPKLDWLRFVSDLEGRDLPPSFDAAPLHALVLRRHAEIDHAIQQRDWFDPWVFQLDEEALPAETVLPWVAGFAAAMDNFPALMNLDHPELIEPLALLYMHFDPADLEDAEALQAVIETLEPPADLAEAVQDLVRSLMLIADISRPRSQRSGPPKGRRPGGRRR
jgi:uncharacterized protein